MKRLAAAMNWPLNTARDKLYRKFSALRYDERRRLALVMLQEIRQLRRALNDAERHWESVLGNGAHIGAMGSSAVHLGDAVADTMLAAAEGLARKAGE